MHEFVPKTIFSVASNSYVWFSESYQLPGEHHIGGKAWFEDTVRLKLDFAMFFVCKSEHTQ